MYRTVKRALDIVISLSLLLLLWLPMLIIAVLVRIDSPGKAIYRQIRLGLDGKEFTMHKFRTMYVSEQRVTRMGRLLRGFADELPQLWDVLRGEMSLVGPRPVLPDEPMPLSEFTTEQMKMFSVRPGITGWAQVNGRRAVPWNERIEMNVWYAQNLSLTLDIKILAMTVRTVLSGKDNE